MAAQTKYYLPVMFRFMDGETVALFPTVPGTNEPHTCQCYAHIGQHSSADLAGVINNSRPATDQEAAPLLAELHRIGYGSAHGDADLKVFKRRVRAWDRQRMRELSKATA